MIFVRLLTSLLFLTPWLFGDTAKEDDYEQYVDRIIYSIAKEAQEELNLSYIGNGGQLARGIDLVEVDFVAYRKGSMEEARKIEVTLMERLLKALNAHEKLRPFLGEYPFPPSRVCIMLSYRQEDGTHYTDGSLTLAFQGKNKLYYFHKPETKNQKILFEEPYEEAKGKVLRNGLEGL